MDGEITTDDLKQELIANWRPEVLLEVASSMGVDLGDPDGRSQEELVDALLQDAPLESLLEELLTRDMASGDEGGPPQGGPDLKDADKLVSAEALRSELDSNWERSEILELCKQYGVSFDDPETIVTPEAIEALVANVPRETLIEELVQRESQRHGGDRDQSASAESGLVTPVVNAGRETTSDEEQRAAATAAALSAAGDADPSEHPAATPQPQDAEAEEAKGQEAPAAPVPARPGKPEGAESVDVRRSGEYDDSSLLMELRSMRREREVEDDFDDGDEEDVGRPLLAVTLVGLVLVGLGFNWNPGFRRRVLMLVGAAPPATTAPLAPTPSVPATEVASTPATPAASPTPEVSATPDAGSPTPTTRPAVTPRPTSAPATEVAAIPTVVAVPTPVPATSSPPLPTTPPVATVPAVTPTATEETGTPPDGVSLVEQLFDQGSEAHLDGDKLRAVVKYEQALRQADGSWSRGDEVRSRLSVLLLDLGERAFLTGDTEQAVKEFQRVVQYAPDSSRGHLYLGRCHERSKDYGKAIDAYRTAVELDSENADAHYYLAYAFRAQGMYDEAEWEANLAELHGKILDPGFKILLKMRPVGAN